MNKNESFAQREPLTKKEIFAIIDKQVADKQTNLPMFYRDQVFDIVRAIENAHGIKLNTKDKL